MCFSLTMYYQLQLVSQRAKLFLPALLKPPSRPLQKESATYHVERVTFHADEKTSKVLEALSNKDNRSQFIRNAIKFYSDNLAVLTRIEERLAEIEGRLPT